MNPSTIAEFTVDKQIAIGGQAKIYKSIKDSQIFAIKVYNEYHQEANQLFLQEMELMDSLDHQGIISPVEYRPDQLVTLQNCETTKRNIVIMKYMKNGDLMNNVIKNGKIDSHIILRIIRSLIDCLKYLLKKDIYHCDIKPQNILLNQRFQPILIDFGFVFSDFKKGKISYPKQYYIAPQIKKGMQYTEKSQSFSLGVLLFILAMGCLPFKQTKHTDPSYRALLEGKHDLFWKNFENHGKCELNSQLKKAIINLMEPNPKRRWTFSDLSESQWFNEQLVSQKEYFRYFYERKFAQIQQDDSECQFPFTDNEQTTSKFLVEESS